MYREQAEVLLYKESSLFQEFEIKAKEYENFDSYFVSTHKVKAQLKMKPPKIKLKEV